MAKGGGGSTVQKQEVTQSNLPEYARPYFENMMQRSQALLNQGYTPYGQERIAGFTPQQQAVQQEVAGMQTPGQFGTATGLTTAAGLGSLAASQYDPSQFSSQQVGVNPLNYFQMEGPDSFGSEQAQQYMSPYVQNVLEIQKRKALEDAQRTQLSSNLGAARQGTYGGSRQLMAGMMRERALGQQMGDIQATGMQSAYQNAQQQFNTEQALRQAGRQQNLAAALGVQDLGTKSGLQAALANQQYDFEAQRAAEASRQFGAQQSLAGLAQAGQMGQTLSNIGSAQQQADAQRLGLQGSTAAQEQALNQQYLDTAYQDFLRQRDFPAEMLQQYSSLLRGVPVEQQSAVTTYAPSVGLGQQLIGTGLSAASIYNTMGRG